MRHGGTDDYPRTSVGGQGATALGMSTETMLDYLGICLDAKELEDVDIIINLDITDEGTKYLLRVHHGVLLHSKEEWSDDPDATIHTKWAGILAITRDSEDMMKATIESVEGDETVIDRLTSHLAEFDPYFNIIEP